MGIKPNLYLTQKTLEDFRHIKSMNIIHFLLLVLTFSAVQSQRGSYTGTYTGSYTRTTVPTTTETIESDYAIAVKALIDAGT